MRKIILAAPAAFLLLFITTSSTLVKSWAAEPSDTVSEPPMSADPASLTDVGVAHLAVALDDGLDAVTEGQTVTYTVTVTNEGGTTYPDARVSHVLPRGARLREAVGADTAVGGETVWRASLGPGEKRVFTVSADVVSDEGVTWRGRWGSGRAPSEHGANGSASDDGESGAQVSGQEPPREDLGEPGRLMADGERSTEEAAEPGAGASSGPLPEVRVSDGVPAQPEASGEASREEAANGRGPGRPMPVGGESGDGTAKDTGASGDVNGADGFSGVGGIVAGKGAFILTATACVAPGPGRPLAGCARDGDVFVAASSGKPWAAAATVALTGIVVTGGALSLWRRAVPGRRHRSGKAAR